MLRVRVKGAGGFVEQNDVGVAQKAACDGDALFLSSAESKAAFSDGGFQSLRKGGDDVRKFGEANGFLKTPPKKKRLGSVRSRVPSARNARDSPLFLSTWTCSSVASGEP